MNPLADPSQPAPHAFLPCPFCGGAPVRERDPWDAACIRVACANPACRVVPRTEYLLACFADELLAAWNSRAAPAADGSGAHPRTVLPPGASPAPHP